MSKRLTLDKVTDFIFSVGAAVVVFGAWMKIIHREGADFFLTVGLLTEVGIFLIYAFFPPGKKQNEPMPIDLEEIMPKRNGDQKKVIITSSDEEMKRFKQNLEEVNTGLEKLKSIFK